MTAPTKPAAPAAQAKPAAKPATKRTRSTAPAIDYSKLSASDAVLPKGTRGSVLDGTPFVDWMKDSRERGVAKSLTVPVAAETQTVYLIRAAAQRVGCGVRIVADKPNGGNVKLTFAGKDKRKHTPKAKTETAAKTA